jgi:hypothetical protein
VSERFVDREIAALPPSVRRGHRLVPRRTGPIVSPRRLDPRPLETARPADARGREAAGDRPTEAIRIARLATAGWSTSTTFEGPDGRECFLVERDLRLDLTSLRWNHLVLALLVLELLGTVSLGLDGSARGVPAWEGTVLIALGAAGAVGFVGRLPVVEFVGTVALIRFGSSPSSSGASAPPGTTPEFEIWVVCARSRNWEVLGDRGGRRILRTADLPDSAPTLSTIVGPLSGLPSTVAEPNPSAIF